MKPGPPPQYTGKPNYMPRIHFADETGKSVCKGGKSPYYSETEYVTLDWKKVDCKNCHVRKKADRL